MLAMKSILCVGVAVVFLSSSSHAQPAASGYSSTVAGAWNRMARLLAASAEAMPDAGYAFKPSPDVRTFGELLGHLAEEHYLFCSEVKGEKNPKEGTAFEKLPTKGELVKALAESIAYCNPVYAAARDEAKMTQPLAPNQRDTPFSNLLMNVTHDSEHYGNLVTYLRMKGIVPPSSQPSR